MNKFWCFGVQVCGFTIMPTKHAMWGVQKHRALIAPRYTLWTSQWASLFKSSLVYKFFLSVQLDEFSSTYPVATHEIKHPTGSSRPPSVNITQRWPLFWPLTSSVSFQAFIIKTATKHKINTPTTADNIWGGGLEKEEGSKYFNLFH